MANDLHSALFELIAKCPVDKLNDFEKDLIWCVTRIRTGSYVLFSSLNLLNPGAPLPEFGTVEPLIKAIFGNYCIIAAQHPERIEYSADKVETPRLDIISATSSVFEQLQSDKDVRQSAEELVRLVATNPDSDHDPIGYATLTGVVARMVAWLYPDVDFVDWLSHILDNQE